MVANVSGLLLTIIILPGGIVNSLNSSKDFILCRSCGSDLASSSSIISKTSPSSSYSFSDTIFNTENTQVQVFSTNFVFNYPIVTVSHSSCGEVGEWEESTSWFPGYRWKPCVCPECGAYIGFVFEPIDPELVEPSKKFYGLILTTVISEHFLDTLIHFHYKQSS